MATKVVMAQLSPTMEEGKLVEWKRAEGDVVEAGEILAEIETDKANMDVEALGAGVLRRILVEAGDTVPVGTLIAVIAGPDEDISDLLAGAAAEVAPSGASAAAPEPADIAQPPEREEISAPGEAPPAPAGSPAAAAPDRLKASPLARRMAREAGVPLSGVVGSGPGGRIVKRDVEAALAAPREPAARRPAGTPRPPGPARLAEERLELSQMRKSIAARLVQSIGPVPHFFLTTEVDMGRALEMRARLNERLASGKVGVNDLLVKVAAEALARHPEINASWDGDGIRRHGSADIGIAVALEDGLITPVVRGADRKGLVQISEEARALIERARARRLLPEEYTGATFSISNLGMFEIDEFTAIINPPESAILAVGATIQKPVVADGEVVVRRRMRVTMSCDHRVIDGAMGAAFLGTFKAMLENPLELVV
ncbi:MAG: dihydrolipoamide acetyltransferase family protein [Gemmatimonadota bacterium]